ncbi:hypothetical protein DMA15_17585 [Streptomyces sp. WAC 01529]|uniref:hypothetical protein n=1 Tax=Streptomyces sp. WAC 01529 TaxID=2203205 RepID=UPI000F6DDA28|nr:hypothetical protein [Streptomyces sp. WAC 01529]AZM54158.1 hypothetical protein DMA15_17585 [Streptomyces sp. WAC 01529]
MPASLPLHPLTGARALGWRKARPGEDGSELYPIWPVLGGAEDDDQDEDTKNDDEPDAGDEDGDDGEGPDDDADGSDDDGDPEGADKLGDPGKRALASMKGKWRSERDKRRALEQQLADKGSTGDNDAIQKATAAATAAANARILRAEVRAAAKGRLNDPKDALTFLDLSAFEVDEDGQIDEDEIVDAIEDLIKNKPYLAAATAKRFQGTGDGGAARKASRPKQLTQSDLKKMTPQQIVKAQDDGRLDDLLGAG